MAWVAVDKDGTEKIFASIPMRRNQYGYHVFIWSILMNLPYTKNQRNKWAAHWSTDRNDPLQEGAIKLPKGKIKKLIGRYLSWEGNHGRHKEEEV